MGECNLRSGGGILRDDVGNVVRGVMNVEGRQGKTEKGQGSGARNIARSKLSASRERNRLSDQREEIFRKFWTVETWENINYVVTNKDRRVVKAN